MQIASVGDDKHGHFGMTGFVDTNFAERFGGGAALISLIGAGLSVAAAQANDDITSNTLESIGEDFEDSIPVLNREFNDDGTEAGSASDAVLQVRTGGSCPARSSAAAH